MNKKNVYSKSVSNHTSLHGTTEPLRNEQYIKIKKIQTLREVNMMHKMKIDQSNDESSRNRSEIKQAKSVKNNKKNVVNSSSKPPLQTTIKQPMKNPTKGENEMSKFKFKNKTEKRELKAPSITYMLPKDDDDDNKIKVENLQLQDNKAISRPEEKSSSKPDSPTSECKVTTGVSSTSEDISPSKCKDCSPKKSSSGISSPKRQSSPVSSSTFGKILSCCLRPSPKTEVENCSGKQGHRKETVIRPEKIQSVNESSQTEIQSDSLDSNVSKDVASINKSKQSITTSTETKSKQNNTGEDVKVPETESKQTDVCHTFQENLEEATEISIKVHETVISEVNDLNNIKPLDKLKDLPNGHNAGPTHTEQEPTIGNEIKPVPFANKVSKVHDNQDCHPKKILECAEISIQNSGTKPITAEIESISNRVEKINLEKMVNVRKDAPDLLNVSFQLLSTLRKCRQETEALNQLLLNPNENQRTNNKTVFESKRDDHIEQLQPQMFAQSLLDSDFDSSSRVKDWCNESAWPKRESKRSQLLSLNEEIKRFSSAGGTPDEYIWHQRLLTESSRSNRNNFNGIASLKSSHEPFESLHSNIHQHDEIHHPNAVTDLDASHCSSQISKSVERRIEDARKRKEIVEKSLAASDETLKQMLYQYAGNTSKQRVKCLRSNSKTLSNNDSTIKVKYRFKNHSRRKKRENENISKQSSGFDNNTDLQFLKSSSHVVENSKPNPIKLIRHLRHPDFYGSRQVDKVKTTSQTSETSYHVYDVRRHLFPQDGVRVSMVDRKTNVMKSDETKKFSNVEQIKSENQSYNKFASTKQMLEMLRENSLFGFAEKVKNVNDVAQRRLQDKYSSKVDQKHLSPSLHRKKRDQAENTSYSNSPSSWRREDPKYHSTPLNIYHKHHDDTMSIADSIFEKVFDDFESISSSRTYKRKNKAAERLRKK